MVCVCVYTEQGEGCYKEQKELFKNEWEKLKKATEEIRQRVQTEDIHKRNTNEQ